MNDDRTLHKIVANSIFLLELKEIAHNLNIKFDCDLKKFSAIEALMTTWSLTNRKTDLDLSLLPSEFDKDEISQLVKTMTFLMRFKPKSDGINI
jgi:hypothetical protein